MASCTEPADSFRVLPISLVSMATIASLCSISKRPMFPIICPRVGAGVADHPVNAFRAARSASWTSSSVERGNSPRQSSNHAGLIDLNVEPSLACLSSPSMILYPFTQGLPFGLLWSRNSRPVESTCAVSRRTLSPS